MIEVWAVVYSNYEPAEVVALYDNLEAATQHADQLGDAWHTERWTVGSTPPAAPVDQ